MPGRIEVSDGWAELDDDGNWKASDDELLNKVSQIDFFVMPWDGDYRAVYLDFASRILNGRVVKREFAAVPNIVH